jgi:ABC-type Fe3+/spermidine/putrescine transport system ATPase subunit
MASAGIRDVKKAFGTTQLVDISTTAGEFVMLVSASGCGNPPLPAHR